MSFFLLKAVEAVMGLRVTKEDEEVGLDLSQHGEEAYGEDMVGEAAYAA